MPQSIPTGLTRAHVRKALADLDARVEHPFGAPTGYEVVHDDRRYAPRRSSAWPAGSLVGSLLPEEFSGGEAPVKPTTSCGSSASPSCERGPEETESEWSGLVGARRWNSSSPTTSPCWRRNCRRGRSTRPTTAGRCTALDGRSKGSIEFKHQNVSAVLVDMGLPYIDGYKPPGTTRRSCPRRGCVPRQEPRLPRQLAEAPS